MISNMTYGTSYTVTSENATCTTVASSSFSIDEILPTPGYASDQQRLQLPVWQMEQLLLAIMTDH